jgi:hypothetical protein
MDLFTKIIETYPELTMQDFALSTATILLADDGDGVQYVAKWEYTKPIPKGLKLGK